MYPFKEPIDEISYFGSDLLPAILRTLVTTGFTVATMFMLSPALTLAILPLVPAFLIARQHFRRRLTVDSDYRPGRPGVMERISGGTSFFGDRRYNYWDNRNARSEGPSSIWRDQFGHSKGYSEVGSGSRWAVP